MGWKEWQQQMGKFHRKHFLGIIIFLAKRFTWLRRGHTDNSDVRKERQLSSNTENSCQSEINHFYFCEPKHLTGLRNVEREVLRKSGFEVAYIFEEDWFSLEGDRQ